MRHSGIAFAAALALVVTSNAAAMAAPLPSGTINCAVSGDITKPNGTWRLRFLPVLSSTPSPNRTRVFTFMQGICDSSGVSGGKAPITNVQAHLVGSLAPGTNCAALTSAPVFERLQLKIKWQSTDGDGRHRTVAITSARFVDADWDGNAGALVFLSTPLKGAFAGSLSTVTLAFDQPELFGAICDNGAQLDGAAYGDGGTSSIAIQ